MEIQKLKAQLSQKTNEILQLREDKEELETKLENRVLENVDLTSPAGDVSIDNEKSMTLDRDKHLVIQLEQANEDLAAK